MLNIRFHRSSAPITEAELVSVIDGIRPAIADENHPDRDYALLLAKMVFRIELMKKARLGQDRGQQPVPVKPNTSLLRPFAACPENELEQAWAAMIEVAAAQQRRAA